MNALADDSPGARRFSKVMLAIAAAALFGACMFTSPRAFSQAHQQDDSIFKTVVSVFGLAASDGQRSAFPTVRSVEIRDLFFHIGAAALMLAFGARLIASSVRPRMTSDDLFDLRRHLGAPYAWWALFLFVSIVSSLFSTSPPPVDVSTSDISLGGAIARLFTFAWWLPLALLLRPIDARRLGFILAGLIALMSLLAIWYFVVRAGQAGVLQYNFLPWRLVELVWRGGSFGRLRYPVGNELWFGTCLLPAIFVAVGGVLAGRMSRDGQSNNRRTGLIVASVFVLLVCVYAFWLTRARSAGAGAFAGACFVVLLLVAKKARPFVLLAAIAIAIVGMTDVQDLRVQSTMGNRAHSIRTRLNHEWPYALTLWFQKPVGGHGEGGYTMLAGRYAREEQLDDPNTIACDERIWTVEAHNEYLQLLADVGLAGTIGFVGALVVTLFWAVRFVDRRRDDPDARADRAMVVGLSAALVAIAFAEGASVGLRHPGLPPLFFTVWACLWAMVRGERPPPVRKDESQTEARSLSPSTVRLGGVVAGLAAIALGFAGVQNWRAARKEFESRVAMTEGRFSDASAAADWAGRYRLDPMRKLVSRELAIEARVLQFGRRIETAQAPPTDADMQIAREATIKSTALANVVPRFLRLSGLKWQLSLIRSRAHQMRGEQEEAADYYRDYATWLAQCREDEPFILDYVIQLWQEVRVAVPAERLKWLRAWLRRNHMGSDPRFGWLMQNFAERIPGSKTTVEDALNIAMKDAEKPADLWSDRLSPETFRIAAAIMDARGDEQKAIEYVQIAASMYESAGGRLFFGQSAALLEESHFRFRADPTGDLTETLETLVRAVEAMDGPLATAPNMSKIEMALPREFGQLRLRILLAHDREEEAARQLDALAPGVDVPIATRLAAAYSRLANEFVGTVGHDQLAGKWAARSEQLDPEIPATQVAKLRLALARGDDGIALAAANRLIELMSDRREAYGALVQAELETPQSGIWRVLRETFPDYPPLPRRPTTQPATQPTTRPASGAPVIAEQRPLANDVASAEAVDSGAP